MSDRSGRFRHLWEDLKRRKVFRTGALYAVIAWVAVQAASIVLPAFHAPDWVMRAVLVFAFAGFPVVLVLAWVLDVTRHGIAITPDEGAAPGTRRRDWWVRPLIAAPLLALIVGGTAWLWTSRLATTGTPEYTQKLRPDEMPIVAVLPLENLTGNKDLNWAGPGVSNLVRDDLAQSRYLAVVSAARTLRLSRESKDTDELFGKAAESGVSHVLTGEILRTPKGLTVTTRLTDLRRNVEAGANRQEGLTPEELPGISTSVASLVKQSLGVPGTEQVDVFAADFATRNIAAYEAFVVGLENFLNFDYTAARQSFETAVAKAPDFAIARYRLAHTLAALGDTGAALEQLTQAKKDSYRLTSRERAYIDAGASYFARDYAQAEKQYRALLDEHPYETEARLLLMYVLSDQDRYEDALAEAQKIAAQDPGDEVAWSAQADYEMKLGRYDAAAEHVQKFLALSPGNPNAHFLQGDAHFFRGEYEEAARSYEEALRLDATFGDSVGRLAEIDVLEGRTASAIDRLVAMARSAEFSVSYRTSGATDAAHLLRASGRCPEAGQLLQDLAAEFAAEKVLEAYALSIRARCRIDEGSLDEALRLANESVAKAPNRTARYLWTLGLVQVAQRDRAGLDRTLAAIRALPAPADPTDAKSAHYLEGLMFLASGDARGAVARLQAAVAAEGREFDVYRVALARALDASGDRSAARKTAREAMDRGPPGELRLELEPGRQQAAQLLRQLGG